MHQSVCPKDFSQCVPVHQSVCPSVDNYCRCYGDDDDIDIDGAAMMMSVTTITGMNENYADDG